MAFKDCDTGFLEEEDDDDGMLVPAEDLLAIDDVDPTPLLFPITDLRLMRLEELLLEEPATDAAAAAGFPHMCGGGGGIPYMGGNPYGGGGMR